MQVNGGKTREESSSCLAVLASNTREIQFPTSFFFFEGHGEQRKTFSKLRAGEDTSRVIF